VAIINGVIFSFSPLSSALLGSLLLSQKEAFLSKLFKKKVRKGTKLGHPKKIQPNRSVHARVRARKRARAVHF
jgi:hypothetical protein